MDQICILRSSSGDVMFDLASGVVVEVEECEESKRDRYLSGIFLVDVKKLLELEPELETSGETDILFAGYWHQDKEGIETYEPPDEDYINGTLKRRTQEAH